MPDLRIHAFGEVGGNERIPMNMFTFLILSCCWWGFSAGLVVAGDVPHHRVVWLQDLGIGGDVFAKGDRHRLMTFDSRCSDGAISGGAVACEPKVLLEGPRGFSKPLITPAGNRVVFTDYPEHKVYVVNWDGTGVRFLANGFGAEVWRQPGTNKEYVLVAEGPKPVKSLPGYERVRLVQIDNPGHTRVIWTGDLVAVNNLQLSADGRFFAAQFPWPNGGVGDLAAGDWTPTSRGCWTSMAPDNSYVSWVFDGAHRNLLMHGTVPGESKPREWTVPVDGAPGVDGREVYHPRWGNHPRVIALTGPYPAGSVARVGARGREAEVYLGWMNAGATEVERWQQITDNKEADFFPDVWVAGGESESLVLGSAGEGQNEPVEVRKVKGSLVEASVIPAPEDLGAYKSCLVLCHYRLADGEEVAAYHWGIRDRKVVPGAARVEGQIYELQLVPYASRKDLKGMRTAESLARFGFPSKWVDQVGTPVIAGPSRR